MNGMSFRRVAIKAVCVSVVLLAVFNNISKSTGEPSSVVSTEAESHPFTEFAADTSTFSSEDIGRQSPGENSSTSNSISKHSSWDIPTRSMFLVDGHPTNSTRLLLDFVVAGFAKCGTTTLGTWFSKHPEINIQKNEQYHYVGGIKRMVVSLFQSLPKSADLDPLHEIKKGFRSPHFIQTKKANLMLPEHFPNARLVVSVRHPVKWFESYYNYRLEQNELSILKGTPNELIGELKCKGCKQHFVLSTAKGEFHRFLARLHKTPLSSPEEIKLLSRNEKWETMTEIHNPIFFVEMSQLGDNNETRSGILRRDLQDFLGLKTAFLENEIPKVRPTRNTIKDNPVNFTKIDICDEEHSPVRTELMHISRNASEWFRQYFLKSDEVFVSSREHLLEILKGWMEDPCQHRTS